MRWDAVLKRDFETIKTAEEAEPAVCGTPTSLYGICACVVDMCFEA
jgi:hypothetical protein